MTTFERHIIAAEIIAFGGSRWPAAQPPYRVDGVPDHHHHHQLETEVDEIEEWRAEHPEDVPEDMIPWARSARPGSFEVRRSPNPEQRTVAASNGGIR